MLIYGYFVDRNARKDIIMEISGVKFGQLRELSLIGNGIESIEPLGRIWMPGLTNLLLGQNKIVSLRPLMRIGGHCLGLEWLGIGRYGL